MQKRWLWPLRLLLELPAIKVFRLYWRLYGRLPALLKSPYVYLAIVLTYFCTPLWMIPSAGAQRAWPQIAVDIIPSMLGFSMGGMAIVLAFSSTQTFKVLTEGGADDSAFLQMIGNFFHFILVQTIAIIMALLGNGYQNEVLSAFGFFMFAYAVLVAVATAGQLLNTAQVINLTASSDHHDNEKNS